MFAQAFLNIGPSVQATYSDTSSTIINLSVSLTSFITGVFMVAAGNIAYKIGYTKITYIGVILSIIGSVIILLPFHSSFLIVGRIVQGFSAAMIMPATISIFNNIFEDIQSVIKTDYARYVDKRNINHPEKNHIYNSMSDREFIETIQDYILDFNDGHMWFIGKNYSLPNIGFKVRRFENSLYVIEAKQENRLQIGDEITKIDNVEISKVGEIHSKQLEESIFERQQWNLLLRKFSEVEVVRDNKTFKLLLSSYENEDFVSTHSAKQLDDKTMLLKVTDFAEEKPIVDLVRNNKDLIEKSENLIIDVRINNGGNDEFYFPLLDYIFEENIAFKDLFTEDEAMYTNYTKRNCDLWLSVLEEYLEQELEEDTIKSLQSDIEDIKEHYGKGFVEVPEETEYLICGQAKPNNIYILTDYYCGSSGETFVSNAKKSMKVITVGRPTMGIMYYFNLVTVDYGDFEFDYSISKMHENSFTYGMGIQPDYYIPWSPEHLKEDKDLLYVQRLIKEKDMRKD